MTTRSAKISLPPRTPATSPDGFWSLARSPAFAVGVIALVALVAYYNSFAAPFVFDDWAAIVENQTIRDWRALSDVFSPPANTGVAGRPLVNLTLAVNYALGGLNPAGYHGFNVAIHGLAGLILFGLVRRTFLRPVLRARFGAAASPLALAVAAIWTTHPLLTESVTCVVQRNEVMVGFLYLLTIYAFLRAVESKRPRAWGGVAIGAAVLGMASKEVMVTAPVMVLLYDRTFVTGSFREAWRQRRWHYAGLAGTWLLLAWLVTSSQQRGGTVGLGLGVSPFEYLLTQCRAIVLYLRLAVWPHPLILDYGNEVVRRAAEVPPQALLLFLLAAGVGVALVRRPAAGFTGAWFLVVLAPSSSVVPLTTQTMAEHRMYLPLAAVVAFTVAALYDRLRSRSGWLGPLVVTGFVSLTIERNHDYRSELAIWEDTAARRPDQARPHNNLGLALFQLGRANEAKAHYEEALRLDAQYSPAQNNLGDALVALGRAGEAVPHYEAALRISPEDARMHYNLANALVQLDRTAEAIPHYEEALRLAPGDANKHHRLGIALFRAGRITESLTQYEQALRLRPDFPEACNNLGTAFLGLGRVGEAREQFERALKLRPDYERARTNLLRLQALEHAGDNRVP